MKSNDAEKLIPEFVITEAPAVPAGDKKPISFWVPIECKEKYEKLQGISGNRYGKFLQSLFVASINETFEKYRHRF